VGARLAEVSPAEHDRTLAYTSHLPQMLSSVLAMTLEAHFGSPENPALQLHAGGLNSMLRLAVSDPAMWEQIALSNPRNISAALERFEAELRHLRLCLEDGEFRRRFEAARDFALALRNRK
jgi:prephenate dehydrogenase